LMSGGQIYNTHNKDYNSMRLGFASLTEEELEEAIGILAGCVGV
jgi:DNA-binding transcriptional MocR family regulator